MATGKRVFATQQQIEGAADGYTTLSGTTEEFSSDIDLETDGYEGVEIDVDINFDPTPTDDVDINIYGRLDSSWDGNEIPVFSQRVDSDNDPCRVPLIIKDFAHVRVGVVQTGSTNSHDVRIYCQRWRWDVS